MKRAKYKMRVKRKSMQIGFKGIVTTLDESILSHDYAKECEGFLIEDDVLKADVGIEKAKGYFIGLTIDRHLYPDMPEGSIVRKVFLYRRTVDGQYDDRLVAHMQDGYFWQIKIFSEDTWHKVEGMRLFGDTCAVNYNFNGEDVLLVNSAGDGLFAINGDSSIYYSNAPQLASITVHNERVWGGSNSTRGEVWFSDDFDPSNWNASSSEGGVIYFADGMGEVLKVVSIFNYIYIFREYGIMRLTAYGKQSDFLLKTMFTDTGYIYKDTIALADDKIIFYAEGGVFVFDGYNTTRICKELPEIFNHKLLCGAYLDNKYYLACRLDDAGIVNNSLIVYDLVKGSMCIVKDVYVKSLHSIKIHKGADVICTFALDRENIIGMMSKDGKILGESTHKKYVSPINNLSIKEEKIIREIHVKTLYPITLSIVLDGNKTSYELQGKNEMQTIEVDKRGFMFGIEIESDSDKVLVSPIRVDMDIVEGKEKI